MARRSRRAFSLVEILVVLVILAVVAWFLVPRYLQGGRTAGGRRVESPVQRAESVECRSNLQQCRQAYQMALASGEEERPRSVQDLRRYGVTESMMRCPVGGEPYRLDPSGRISCVHPGHAAY